MRAAIYVCHVSLALAHAMALTHTHTHTHSPPAHLLRFFFMCFVMFFIEPVLFYVFTSIFCCFLFFVYVPRTPRSPLLEIGGTQIPKYVKRLQLLNTLLSFLTTTLDF